MEPFSGHRGSGLLCPVADQLADTVLSLPIGPHLDEEEVIRIAELAMAEV
jgi:dTDP-4-amino-4,6-dideoxygalactose transaminase